MTRAEKGFTLVELLIALALAAIVSLLAVEATRFASQGLARVSTAAQRLDARRALEGLLRGSLATALAPSALPNERALDGDGRRMRWLAAAEDGGAGLYRWDLYREGDALVLTRTPLAGGAERRTVLAPRARLRLSYFGTGWHDTWQGMAALPRLVRVTLDLEDGLARPPIVVRLVAAGP